MKGNIMKFSILGAIVVYVMQWMSLYRKCWGRAWAWLILLIRCH